MAQTTLTKQGSFDADLMNAINAMFAELYASTAGGALASGKILVGSAGNLATARTMSGDGTLSNTGVLAVLSIGGYKIRRGVHTQVAASDTVVTGLTTVVAIISTPQTRTVKQLFFNASIGDQAGTPAAGSVLLSSQKPTATGNVTPVDATDFTDNIAVNWVAIGV